jgi:membrane carboxypeptidase/penicillin-binding protein PbpC
MAIENILAGIDAEIARLQRARALLATLDSVPTKASRKTKKAPAAAKSRKRRVLSAEARKRIADAQHRRWAKLKAKQKG